MNPGAPRVVTFDYVSTSSIVFLICVARWIESATRLSVWGFPSGFQPGRHPPLHRARIRGPIALSIHLPPCCSWVDDFPRISIHQFILPFDGRKYFSVWQVLE